MSAPVVYDITRLVTRMLNETPNGIDRVDFAYASHFLDQGQPSSACLMSFLGPREFPRPAAKDAVDGIAGHWGESDDPDDDIAFREVVARLEGKSSAASKIKRISRRRSGQVKGTWRWLRTHGFPLGWSLAGHVPHGAVYVNVSQFPLWIASYFNWLKKRPDVKPVFFIHDLLPLERPEFFRPAEQQRHKKRLANLAAFGAAAITSTETVHMALTHHMKELGRSDMPILALPLPVAPIFNETSETQTASLFCKRPYFICCGTIEPRKNHLLLLHLWCKLVELYGTQAPKLVLIGTRGWENENAIDLLERSIALRDVVIEVSGLSTPALKHLLDGACALLMPSFAEGYGLPLAEALAAGVPVVASDIPAFREIGGDAITRLSPIAGDRWLDAIISLAGLSESGRQKSDRVGRPKITSESYFARVDEFIAKIR